MARGKKATDGDGGGNKKGGSGKQVSETETVETELEETNVDDMDQGEDEEEEVETWDLIRLISQDDGSNKNTNNEDGGGNKACCCRVDNCTNAARVVWASNLNPNDEWPLCLACQEKDFNGFPDDLSLPPDFDDTDRPFDTSNNKKKDDKIQGKMKVTSADEDDKDAAASDNDGGGGDSGEEEEQWDVKKIMSIHDVTNCPVLCSTEGCTIPAAVILVSNLKPTEKWYSCIPCQEEDFGGWPPVDELPLKYMTEEHKKVLVTHCSDRANVEMPEFDPAMAPSASPKQNESLLPNSHHTSTIAANAVTPMPGQCFMKTTAIVGTEQHLAGVEGGAAAGSTVTPAERVKKTNVKPSKKDMETHAKWQKEAEAMGGKDARIVVSKPKAKALIFELLRDEFAPMNITTINSKLKAVVPVPVLRACLNEMALDKASPEQLFDDSDDEEEKPASKKKAQPSSTSTEPYEGSLCLKAGKSAGTSLYYVDHTKLKNNGNGLDCDEKNTLYSEVAKSNAEKDFLLAKIKEDNAIAAKLLSEPTNEEAIARLEAEEATLSELRTLVEDSRQLKGNEKIKAQLKRRVDKMAAEWRKRRRITMDFLVTIEEMTDGTVSSKKCLAGDGQIELDSDEAVNACAVAYAKKKTAISRPAGGASGSASMLGKRSRSGGVVAATKNKKPGRGENDSSLSLPPGDENFVAVSLDSQGRVQRIYLEDADN